MFCGCQFFKQVKLQKSYKNLQKVTKKSFFKWRHDTQHIDIPHNDTQHNDTRHNGTAFGVLLGWVSLMLSVIYAECHLCWVSFMLSVIYAECHLCWLSIMLSVTNEPFILSFVMPNVVTLNVVAPPKKPCEYPPRHASPKKHFWRLRMTISRKFKL